MEKGEDEKSLTSPIPHPKAATEKVFPGRAEKVLKFFLESFGVMSSSTRGFRSSSKGALTIRGRIFCYEISSQTPPVTRGHSYSRGEKNLVGFFGIVLAAAPFARLTFFSEKRERGGLRAQSTVCSGSLFSLFVVINAA